MRGEKRGAAFTASSLLHLDRVYHVRFKLSLSDSQVEKMATAMQEPSSPTGFNPSECRRGCNKRC